VVSNEKSNICIFIRSLLRGGAEKQSILLADYLSKFFEVHLVVLYPSSELLDFARDRSVDVIQLRGPLLLRIGKFFLFLKRKHIDILFCYLPSNNIIGGLVGKAAGVKTVFGGLRGAKLKESAVKMALQKFVCNHISDVFIANNEAARKTYVAYGYKASKVMVIPNMIDMNGVPERAANREEDVPVTVVSVGRFVDEKDYSTALKAMQIVINRFQSGKVKYLIVGYGPLKGKIEEEVKTRDLQDYVEIIDGQVEGAVGQSLEIADIFLITSKFEGMPNAVMEAMMHAIPVVATDAGDMRKLVVSGENGFVCRVGAYEDISKKLLYLIENDESRQKMGTKSYGRIRKKFSMERVGGMYLELLRSYS